MDALVTAAAFILALVLGSSAIDKARAPDSFGEVLQRFSYLPSGLRSTLRYGTPTAELIVAGALALQVAARPAALASMVLVGAFTIAVMFGNAMRPMADCGCGGVIRHGVPGRRYVLVNVALVCLSLPIIFAPPDPLWSTGALQGLLMGQVALAVALLLNLGSRLFEIRAELLVHDQVAGISA